MPPCGPAVSRRCGVRDHERADYLGEQLVIGALSVEVEHGLPKRVGQHKTSDRAGIQLRIDQADTLADRDSGGHDPISSGLVHFDVAAFRHAEILGDVVQS